MVTFNQMKLLFNIIDRVPTAPRSLILASLAENFVYPRGKLNFLLLMSPAAPKTVKPWEFIEENT